ncbi:hypothetical protein [Allosediminivita pacifica]|uniref:Uncharacterized protein n=1 Tax=Allosediminivita pacifica TaxID=1267769 RepID=A0A2T5ZV54_9RHOB|nr:hypothetical protein [Allosediminivita pacifica]PTX35449.1 hypothetical protein C8N44_1811 [Allosediminivita pacifica]GGB31518.1 hypothetical protein GCM10011324_46120 [Allosediminivita pacifica]
MTGQYNDHCESADNYAAELCRIEAETGSFCVIVCRDGIQWIIQRRIRATEKPAAVRWVAESYVTSREALLRLWQAHSGISAPAELHAMPAHFIRPRESTRS